MRRTSWEIVLAGLFFVGIAIYVVANQSDNTSQSKADHLIIHEAPNKPSGGEVKVINLESLKNLEKLKELKQLENLEKVEQLEKLKSLANFLPAEVRDDFIEELNTAIEEETSKDGMDIKVNLEKGIVAMKTSENIDPGVWNTVSPGVFAYKKTFDSSELKEASLQLPHGSISVSGNNDGVATLVLRASGQIDTRNDLINKLNILSESTNTSANLVVKPAASGKNENIHLQAELSLPANTTVALNTMGGHIEAAGLNGTQSYNTGGGHIRLQQLDGEINALTSGGHIEINDSKGILELESMGGHISTSNCSGTTRMKTTGGNLKAINYSGNLEANTNGGNIEILLAEWLSNVEARTGSGSVVISIPSDASGTVNLAGTTVDIQDGIPFTGDKAAGYAKGQIGSSKHLILAKTNYGKVFLKRND